MGRRYSKLRRRLEDRLLDALIERFGEGAHVAVVCGSVQCVEGAQRREDCRRWDATIVIDDKEEQVSSWDTVTDCVRKGVYLEHWQEQERPDHMAWDAIRKG